MRALVIGSGFGGLALAVRLAVKGYEVTILEKRDRPGGRASVFVQDGFTFDAGPTIITAPYLLGDLFTLAGRRIEDYVRLFPLDPFYRIRFDDGTTFDCSGDPERMRTEVRRVSQEDVEGYEAFMARSRAIFEKGYLELGHVPFLTPWSMVRAIPALVRLECYRSVLGLVRHHVRSEKLRQALSFHPLFVGGDPQHAPAIYALISHLERTWGVHFAEGGMGAVVNALVRLLRDLGAEIRFEAPVERIEIEGGRARAVRVAGGERVPADLVVSNGDVSWTYQHLIEPRHRPHNSDRRLRRLRYSMSLFLAYFGTDRTYPELRHHTIVLGPRYGGLLDDVFRHKRLAPDMSLYLHAPTRSDPSLAPPGCETFYVLSPVPNLAADVDWTATRERYRDAVYDRLEATCVPGLRRHLVTERLFTPLDFRDEHWSHLGAAFSFEPTLLQSAWFRGHNRCPDVPNLYFVGAGTHPGAGIPGVLSSARVTDSLIPPVGAATARPAERRGAVPDIAPADLAVCEAAIRERSRSFFAASRLLPARVRHGAVATYAFCRAADDAVDEGGGAAAARERHDAIRRRLDAIYRGEVVDTASGRAFAAVVAAAAIPRAEPEALLAGMAQDLGLVRVADEDALLLYCYRAAGVVGRMMSRIMGRNDDDALARAVHLGVAMQLTNIARDVGEDARRDRVYLPATWLAEAGGSHADVLAGRPSAPVRAATRRALALAERYYASGIAGIGMLAPACRPAILSAALLYRAIGRRVAARDGDGVSARARVGAAGKAGLIALALARTVLDPRLRRTAARPDASALHGSLRRAGVPS